MKDELSHEDRHVLEEAGLLDAPRSTAPNPNPITLMKKALDKHGIYVNLARMPDHWVAETNDDNHGEASAEADNPGVAVAAALADHHRHRSFLNRPEPEES